MNEGLLDTNVIIHAHQVTDDNSNECLAFLEALERGDVRARLEPVVAHELTYTLPRVIRQFTRATVAQYLATILKWPGITGEKGVLLDAVERWQSTPGLAFIDAYLAATAVTNSMPVFTKNVRELTAQGAEVPVPLPS